MKTSPSDCPPRRTRVHATAKVAETSANIFPLLPAPETAWNERLETLFRDPPRSIEQYGIYLYMGGRGEKEEGKNSISWVYGIGSNESPTNPPPVSRNIAFPRDPLLDFHYLSLSLLRYARTLWRIVFFVRTILVVVVVERDWEYRFLSRS